MKLGTRNSELGTRNPSTGSIVATYSSRDICLGG